MNIRTILRSKILTMIKNDLTIGRTDNDLQAFKEEQINTFIDNNNNNIDSLIDVIIIEYTEQEIATIEYSQILEYLVDYIAYP